MQKNLTEFAASKGFPVFELDGVLKRFDHAGIQTGWFKGDKFVAPSGLVIEVAKFGDWKSDEKYSWSSTDNITLTPEQAKEAKLAQAQIKQQEKESQELAQHDAALACFKIWTNSVTQGSSPYLERKGLPPHELFGCRLDLESEKALAYGVQTLVPAFDIEGNLHGLQKISKDGFKSLYPGMRIQGCFSPYPVIIQPKNGVIYLAEGISTAASIHMATGEPVLSCFNAANLVRVAALASKRWPHCKIIICGDNDKWTLKQGKPWNPGWEYAQKAAKACGGVAVFPVFGDYEPDADWVKRKLTDFNDLHVTQGLEAVGRSIEDWLAEKQQQNNGNSSASDEQKSGSSGDAGSDNPQGERVYSEGFGEFDAMPPRQSPTGKPLAPRQQPVVDHMLRQFDGKLVKQDRDVFMYTGTHWRWLTLGDHDRLKIMIQKVCSGQADIKFIDAVYKLLIINLPTPPESINMFTPHAFAANFVNGTLHLHRKPDHTYETIFKPHQPTDFLINVLPYTYDPESKAQAHEFLDMLERIFDGDPDKSDKIRAVQQMYGACLVPAFPRLFMCYGGPGTGKSTVLNIAKRLVNKENLCSVPPSEFHGFNMEGMAGKLVNIDTDIPLDQPISDAAIKKVIERGNFRVRRKGIKDLDTTIPSVHLFGGNGIPKTLDGASRAHDRRWTFLGFHKFSPQGQYPKEFWDWVFEQSPEGVLNFALGGLADLCHSRGHFVNPESGRKKMEEWQNENDVTGLFLKAISEGEVSDENNRIFINKDDKIERKRLWPCFVKWFEDEFKLSPKFGRTKFFSALEVKKYEIKKSDGIRYVMGIGLKEAEQGQF